jgi:hypothetical protein
MGFMEPLRSREVIYDYRVTCDETTNTPETIDKNELHGSVIFKPLKGTVDFVEVNFTLGPDPGLFKAEEIDFTVVA